MPDLATVRRRLEALVRLFRASGSEPPALPKWLAFDAEWYVLAYPEAGQEIADGRARNAEQHYRRFGAARGFDPNAVFSERDYRQLYGDVAEGLRSGAIESGYQHFERVGYLEGRRPNDLVVDAAWYANRYPDAAAAVPASDERFEDRIFEHYLRIGAREGRDPHPAFAEDWYRRRYPDVATRIAGGRWLCGYRHFMEEGLAEGRRPHPDYDEDHYVELYHDVEEAVADGSLAAGYLHLLGQGLPEGRPWRRDRRSDEPRRAATTIARCRLDEFLASGGELVFEGGERPRVSVLIVLYNRAELTLLCLEALDRTRGTDFEVVMVDNASSDATRRLLERLRGVRTILNDENEGFVRAANQAAAAAAGEYLLFLNNDAEVFPSSLAAALERFEADPEAGAVGGRVIGLDGKLQEAGSIVWNDATTQGYGRDDDPTSGAYLFPRQVDYCSGVFLMTPRRLFEELGGFDLRFVPAYYEESDYCFRLRRHGYTVIYEPRSVLLHFGSASLPDERHLSRMLAANRSVFRDAHRAELEAAYPPSEQNLFAASDRRRFRGRVLLIDDHVPLEARGGGSPRNQEILHALCELGYFVTFFATNEAALDPGEVDREFPEEGLELVHHLRRKGFAAFWASRRGSYDVLVVSRPHNFEKLLDSGFDAAEEGVRLVYDAEAVVSLRGELRRRVLGGDAVHESELTLEREIDLARAAGEVWAVNEKEARMLAAPEQRASVVSLAARGTVGPWPPGERQGLLFVGRLDEAWNPNVDGLRWYLEEVHPGVRERLGEVGVTIVGDPGKNELPRPENVRFLGRVADLGPLYDEHRVFLVPTRFAAGIPQKVIGAAAHGLPVVATSLVAAQLDWHDGVEIADGGDNDPERFAEKVAELYEDHELWQKLREAALERVEREYSREAMRRALERALATAAEEG